MFPQRYFPGRYFAGRYWPKVGATPVPGTIRNGPNPVTALYNGPNPITAVYNGPTLIWPTPSDDPAVIQQAKDDGADTVNVPIVAPTAGRHLIFIGASSHHQAFFSLSDNGAGVNPWIADYQQGYDNWGGSDFGLSIDIRHKIAEGDETLITGSCGTPLDAAVAFVLEVANLDTVPLDVIGPATLFPGTGLSLSMVLQAAAEAGALLTGFGAFRDDDVTSFDFSNITDILDDSVVQSSGTNFSLTGMMAAEVKAASAAHSSDLTMTATSGAEELMGVLISWKKKP